MKPIEELSKILRTGSQSVEKDVKELRKWCKLYIKWNETFSWYKYITCTRFTLDYGKHWRLISLTHNWLQLYSDVIRQYREGWEKEYTTSWNVGFKVIWNPLSLKHLMMYCDEKKIIFDINIFDWILTLCWMEDIFSKDIEYNIELELHEQEEETLVDIINFLKG